MKPNSSSNPPGAAAPGGAAPAGAGTAPQAEKQPLLIESLDTTSDGLKPRLELAANATKKPLQSGETLKLAVFRFIADTLKIPAGALRQQAWQQFDACPLWFGSNASAMRQAYKITDQTIDVDIVA